jgi:AcrR family transcriptional regulator
VVERHQRERVAAAIAGILAEEGYAAVSVERLRRRAGISRSTFYKYFANKEEAVIASYDLYFHRFRADMEASCSDQPDNTGRIRVAIAKAFELAAGEPATAQFVFGASICAEPVLTRHVMDMQRTLLTAICADDEAPPTVLSQAALGAVAQMLSRRLLDGDLDDLAALQAEVVELHLRLEEKVCGLGAGGKSL